MNTSYLLLGILTIAVIAAIIYYASESHAPNLSAPELSVGEDEISQIGAVNPEINLPADIGVSEENVGIDDIAVDVNDVIVDLPKSI